MIQKDYANRVYAGWLGKVIGVRYGAPYEMWTAEQIAAFFGELNGYVAHYEDFAADDDTNGPLFFVRALEDYTHSEQLTSRQIGQTLLNYSPCEHGFFWWGGEGVSTEHTAYANLSRGIAAPQSGSFAQNGPIIPEQIGGQIFIDCWGLVIPNDPKKAARYARKAAQIAWDGDGVYGGMFVAAMISAAFGTDNIRRVIKAGLNVIPAESGYAQMVRDLCRFYEACPDDWRKCLDYITKNYWIDRYPGNCHIIPNAAIMVLAMLYGRGKFTRTLNICAMCGFDTDCNVGNLGTVLGVMNGLEGMDLAKWQPEIHDFQAASSVVGSLNITDCAESALYMAKLGYRVAEEEPPEAWADFLPVHGLRRCHFELPYSTHALRCALSSGRKELTALRNTDEAAYTGRRCAAASVASVHCGEAFKVFLRTYYAKEDFANGRYQPVTSPIAYPGQRVSAAVRRAEGCGVKACMYALDAHTGTVYCGNGQTLDKAAWTELTIDIPNGTTACIKEIGLWIEPTAPAKESGPITVYVDDLAWQGAADYTLDFAQEYNWSWLNRDAKTELSQFTRLKGFWYIKNGAMHGYASDFAETYTGDVAWRDYTVSAPLTPHEGRWHGLCFRVQGAMRCYAAALTERGYEIAKKVEGTYKTLAVMPFDWQTGRTYTLHAAAEGNRLTARIDDMPAIVFVDEEKPYLNGCIGAALGKSSHCAYGNIGVAPVSK